MNIKDKIDEISKLQAVETPFEVVRSGIEPKIYGDQICLTKWSSADFLTLEEAKSSVKWLAEQLGFVVSEPK